MIKNEDDLPTREGATAASTYAIPDIEPLQGMLTPEDVLKEVNNVVDVDQIQGVGQEVVQRMASAFASPPDDLPPITSEEKLEVSGVAAESVPVEENTPDVVLTKPKPEPMKVELLKQEEGSLDHDELVNLMTSEYDEEDRKLFTAVADISKKDNKYKVKEGDNLWGIAKANNVSIEQLVKWNNIENPDAITAGVSLVIGGEYEMGEMKKLEVEFTYPPLVATPVTTQYLANNYNASKMVNGVYKEREQYKARMDRLEASFQAKTLTDTQVANIMSVDNIVLDHVESVFSIEMASTGLDVDEIRDAVRRIYGAETNYGTSDSLVSPTGAQGHLQVMQYTMKDLHSLGVLGPNFRKATGLSETALNKMVKSADAMKKFLLENKKGNVLVGIAKIVTMVKHTQNKNKKEGTTDAE